MEKNWSELTKEEKREQRLKNYINPPPMVKFRDAKAEKMYHERVDRLLAANMYRKPDRVPVSLPTGAFPAYYYGYDFKTTMYDYNVTREVSIKFMNEFYDYMGTYMGGMSLSGRAL